MQALIMATPKRCFSHPIAYMEQAGSLLILLVRESWWQANITLHLFLPAAKPRRSMDDKYEVGGTAVVYFLGIFCK